MLTADVLKPSLALFLVLTPVLLLAFLLLASSQTGRIISFFGLEKAVGEGVAESVVKGCQVCQFMHQCLMFVYTSQPSGALQEICQASSSYCVQG